MLQTITYDGCFFDLIDSRQYIEFRLVADFECLNEFLSCEGVMSSSYWGDVELLASEEEYQLWIVEIARKILKP